VAFPFFSVKSENRGHWLGAYKKFNRLNHILIPLVVVAGMILVPPFIKIAFAGKYNHSLFFFHLLSIGWMFKSMNIMKGTALMGYGKFNLNFYGSLVSILISFPLMFLLISHYDLLGAAVARIAAGIITYLVTLLVFRHFLKSQQSGA
jgi:O-antigen/teichoic acid export membrane protein